MSLCTKLVDVLKIKNPEKQLWIVEENQVRIHTGVEKT